MEQVIGEQVKDLLKTSADEIKELLSTKRVVGEPIQIGNCTVIPLVSLGFGFAGGGGSGKGGPAKAIGEGEGGGTGGGGGIKPVALIIIDDNGVRLEPVRGTVSSMAESLADLAAKVLRRDKKDDKKDDKPESE